jgi:ABC-2 type transport system ATP-binding protein
VDKVEPLADGRLRLHYLKGADPTEGLVQESVRQGWGLFELTPERRSLEEVFIALTCGEESAREQTLPLRQKTASPTQT